MKSFLLTMLVGVGVATVVAVALVRAVWPETAGEAVSRPRPASGDQGAYSPQDAIETVAARLGDSPKAERLKQSLRLGGRAEYHSPRHWTVYFNDLT